MPSISILSLLLLLLYSPLSICSITCNRFSCETCPVEFFLEFIIDSSSSVGFSEFQLAKDFTYNIIQALEGLNSHNSRLAYVTFDNSVHTHHRFSSNFTKNDLLSMIKMITYNWGGETNFNLVLKDALTEFQKYPISSKSRVIVFITDGFDEKFDVENIENLMDINVKIFAIGVGSINTKTLGEIASSPELVFTVSEYSDLPRIQDAFIKSICDEPIMSLVNKEIASDIVGLVPKYYEFFFDSMQNVRINLKSHAKVQMYASAEMKTPWKGTNSSNIGSHNGYTNDGSEEKILTLKGSKAHNGKVYLALISDTNSSFSLKINECHPKICYEGNNEKINIDINNIDHQGSSFILGIFVGVLISAVVFGFAMWRKQKKGILEEYDMNEQKKLARVEMI